MDISSDKESFVALQWATSWLSPNWDLDLQVFEDADNATAPIAFPEGSTSSDGSIRQGVSVPPVEIVHIDRPGKYRIKIKNYNGTDNIEFKLLCYNGKIVNNGSNHIYGHSAYPNVISVAAYESDNENAISSFSSRGPSTMCYSFIDGPNKFNSRQVPTITATSRVQTYIGSESQIWPGGYPYFGGASASAPHVAGMAALYFQACSTKTNSNFFQDLTGTANTISGTGTNGGTWNMNSGYGKANALETVNKGANRTATPVFSKQGGTYYNTSSIQVSISCATSGATIRYTLNPNEEVTSSSQICSPGTLIPISGSKTIKAKAFMPGMLDSFTSSAFYDIKNEPAPLSGDKALWELKPSDYMGVIRNITSGVERFDVDKYGSSRYCVGTGAFIGGATEQKARPFYQWYLGGGDIPSDADIASIKLEFQLYEYPTSDPQSINLYKVTGIDHSTPENTWKSIESGGVLLTKNTPISVLGAYLTVNITPNSPYFDTFVSELKKSLASYNSFTLGIVSASENNDPNKHFVIDAASQYSKLTITFNSPARQLTARNKLGTGDVQYNQGEIGIDNVWQKSPFTISSKWKTNHIVEAAQRLEDTNHENWKFTNWVENSLTSSSHTVNLLSNTTYSANFKKIFNLTVKNNLEGLEEQGLIYQGNPVTTGYTDMEIEIGATRNVTAMETLTGNDGEDYQFSIWSDGITTAVHPPITMNSTKTLTAYYKHSKFSSTSTAFSNSSQRKFIRTPDGCLHLVYESMGFVWYERSSDGGNSWILMNNGKPLSINPSKSPSIDYCGNASDGVIGIVFQDKSSGLGQGFGSVKYYPVKYYEGAYSFLGLQDIDEVWEEYDSFDSSPVIAFGSTSPNFLVVWKGSEGLMTRYYESLNQLSIHPLSATSLLESITDQVSEHPCLISNKQGNSGFHLAWDQNTSSSTGDIRYCKLSAGPTVNVVQGSYNSNLSLGSGFVKNSMPNMIASSDIAVRMTWLGTSSYGRKADAFRGTLADGTWNSRFWSFGSNVASQSMNLGSDGYYILFSDFVSGVYKNQFSDSRTLSNIYTLNTTGKYIQINNDAGGTSSKMYAMSFYTDGLPYMFEKSYYSIGHFYGLNKSVPDKAAQISGRGVILSKEGKTKYYFLVEDISAEGKSVGFINVRDTVKLNGVDEINGYLVTEPF